LVGGDVVDGVGGYLGGVEGDVAHERSVEERFDAEVEGGLRAGDGRANKRLPGPRIAGAADPSFNALPS
jgi:hypothetical protein